MHGHLRVKVTETGPFVFHERDGRGHVDLEGISNLPLPPPSGGSDRPSNSRLVGLAP